VAGVVRAARVRGAKNDAKAIKSRASLLLSHVAPDRTASALSRSSVWQGQGPAADAAKDSTLPVYSAHATWRTSVRESVIVATNSS
jgi:hypothetical protein